MKTLPEVLLHLQVAPDEVIALNLAMSYFIRCCKHTSPVYEEARELMERFQRRMNEQLPPQQSELRH